MSALEFIKELEGKNYIDGRFEIGKGELTPVIDPATESLIGTCREPDAETVERAIGIANESYREWWALGALERAEALHEVSRKMKQLATIIGEAMSREMGKPYREAFWEPDAAANAFNYYAELAKHDAGNIAGPGVAGQMHFTLKEPLGVAVCIVPYNFPILLLAWKVSAALAAGNSVIIKPSDLTSFTTLIAMKAFDHLPNGLVQVLTGGPFVGKMLVEHPQTHAVAFTGSDTNGKAVAQACASQFKPALIEASGNDPFIVMPSAPIELAARGVAYAAFLNCGQVCTSAERIFVHESIHDKFANRLAEITKALRIGRGLGLVDLGPLAARRERERYEPLLERAVNAGARVLAGGGRPQGKDKGWFVDATVLTDVTPDMEIVNTEPFGPVAPIVKIQNLDEAITLANDSKYGLGANIFTHELPEAMRAINEIESGMVWVNTPLNDNDAVPFGGRKGSGIGRELGVEGLEQFRQSKMVILAHEIKSNSEDWFPYQDDILFTGELD